MASLFESLLNFNSRRNKNSQNNTGVPDAVSYGASYASTSSNTIPVDKNTVMTIPAFKLGMSIITGAIASFPLTLKQNDTDLVPNIINSDYRLGLINNEPNETMTGVQFKTTLVSNLVLYGNALIYIERADSINKNKVTGLYILPNDKVQIQSFFESDDSLAHYGIYTYNANNGTKVFDSRDGNIINISLNSDDGIVGHGALKDGREVLELALQQMSYEEALLSNGAMPSGIVSSVAPKLGGVFDHYKDEFKKAYQGIHNAGSVIFLQGDVKYQKIQADPASMQLDSNTARTTSNIARLLNIPEVLINSSANKYDSNEQNNLQFYQYGIAPLLSAIESAFNRDLLLESEKQKGFFFEFDNTSLMQNTLDEKVSSWGKAFSAGIIKFDEYRQKVGLQPLNGTEDFTTTSIGKALYYPNKKIMVIPNTGTVLDTETGKIISQSSQNNGVQQSDDTGKDNDVNENNDNTDS